MAVKTQITLQGLRDRLVIKKTESPTMTPGGLHIPDVCQEKPISGEVVSAGPGRWSDDGVHVPVESRVGDIVYFPKHLAVDVEIEGEKFSIIREAEVLARVPKSQE